MTARIYTVSFAGVAVTTAVDLFEITPATNKSCEIIGLFLGQSSDAGDAEDELLRYSVIRGHATSGSGGSAPTPRPVSPSATAAGFTAETNNTTAASTGTSVTLHSDTFNVRAGEKLWLPESTEWGVSAGAGVRIVVRLGAAPVDSLTMNGTLYVRELG